jgi:hypothetical protein
MPLFGRRSKEDQREASRPSPERPPGDPDGMRDAANALSVLFESKVQDAGGRIRVEDLLSAAAAACGEACIAAAGDYNLEHHNFVPGSPVLSDRVNGILCADAPDWAAAAVSVFGIIRGGVLAQGYASGDFPPIDEPIRAFVTAIDGGAGGAGDGNGAAPPGWGFVPLTVPADNRPFVEPLRQAYELRAPVRAIFAEHQMPVDEWPTACAFALVIELARVRDAIDRTIAVRLVLETVNGMAKTAPMTDRHFQEAAAGRD